MTWEGSWFWEGLCFFQDGIKAVTEMNWAEISHCTQKQTEGLMSHRHNVHWVTSLDFCTKIQTVPALI